MKPININKKEYTPKFSPLALMALIGIAFVIIFFVVLSTEISSISTAASSSSLASSAEASSSSAVSSAVGSVSSAASVSLGNVSQLGFLRENANILAGSPLFLSVSSDTTPFPNNAETIISIIFMAIALVEFLLLGFDLILRQKVSHIGYVLALGLVFSVYSLIRVFLNIQMGSSFYSGAFFFGLAFVASLFLLYFFVKKALDGDADWRFQLAAWMTVGSFFFGVVSTYSILDLYGSKDDPIFWIGLLSMRIMIFLLVTAIVVSVKCDYDPNPILLDEFGNPVDTLKGPSSKENANKPKAKASSRKDSSDSQDSE